jgi:hypothetical protein
VVYKGNSLVILTKFYAISHFVMPFLLALIFISFAISADTMLYSVAIVVKHKV